MNGGPNIHNRDYIRQKLMRALRILLAHPGGLAERLPKAWREMGVIDPIDLDGQSREDFEYVFAVMLRRREAPLTEEDLVDVAVRIQRIHDAVVKD
jgi:hypothetical protein